MNELLAEARVLPLHAQVSAHDRGTTDLPEWVTGSEATVHSERAVVVATRPDTVSVAPGEHRLAVFVHPAKAPSVVSFVLGRQPWT